MKRLAGVLVLALVSGCYSPSIASCQYTCALPDLACPEDMFCNSDRDCVNSIGETCGPPPQDSGPPNDSMPPPPDSSPSDSGMPMMDSMIVAPPPDEETSLIYEVTEAVSVEPGERDRVLQ